MHVLITGGCGFIGAHAVEHWLLGTDWRITVLDSLRHAGDVSRLTATGRFDRDRVKVLWHDLRAPLYESLVEDIGAVDCIVNMASDSHVDRSIADPVRFIQNNVGLALHILEYARQAKPSKFIQVGTDEIFGPAPDGVSHAEGSSLRPSNPYSASKAAQEMIAFAYWRTYGVPVLLTRTMNNFGERQHPEKFVPMVIRCLQAGEPVTVHAQPLVENPDPINPTHWRPGSRVWLHARNHADAIQFLIENIEAASFGKADTPTAFNVAGEQELDNLEVVTRIAKVLGKVPCVRFVDFHSCRPGHDLRYSLDGSALRSAGWVQPMDLDQSFERMVRWHAHH